LGFVGVFENGICTGALPPLPKGAMLAGGKRLSPTESKMRRGPSLAWWWDTKNAQMLYFQVF